MGANGAHEAGVIEKEASEIFAGFVAERAEGKPLSFEVWVKGHPRHESALRALHEHWSTFERELGRLHDEIRSPVPPSEPQAGSVIGDFRLIDVLGEGGMGRVWRAAQVSLEREVALKVVLPRRQTPRGLSFFDREARAAGRVRHPGVVTVFGAGEDDGVRWIATELIPGGRTLRHFLDEAKREECFPDGYFGKVARLFAGIAAAVAAAHAAGVIHRDLKPQNIMLAPDGAPKVTDFGLARIVDEDGLSKTGDFAGTYFYMSPEQVAARRIGLDHRTDVFSLGAVLYEALTLRRPFDAPSGYEVAEKILYEEPPDPHELSAEVPRELAWICVKALEKRRGDRYSSMELMRDELLRFAEKRPVRTRPAGFARRLRKRVMRHPMRHALLAVSLASLAVCGLLLALAHSSDENARRLEFDLHLARARLVGVDGNLALAEGYARRAIELVADDPAPHLELAAAYTEYDRHLDRAREMKLAREKGYARVAHDQASPRELLYEALAQMSEGDRESMAQAEEVLELALERDPTISQAHLLLFHLRVLRKDSEAALASLRTYRTFGSGARVPELQKLLEAYEYEHLGDHERALSLLRELNAQSGESNVRLDRALGRVYLSAGYAAEAKQHLELALQAEPGDFASRVNLAFAYLIEATSGASADPAHAGLARADELAHEALEFRPDHPQARAVVAQVAAAGAIPPFGSGAPELVAEAIARTEAALDVDPDEARLRELRGNLRYWHGREAHGAGRWGEAAHMFELALQDDPDHVTAYILRSQALWCMMEFGAALDAVDAALERLDDPDQVAQRQWPRELTAMAHAWVLWSAMELGLEDRCLESIEALEAQLQAGTPQTVEVLINYAKFLATSAIESLRDCRRLHALFEEHGALLALRDDPSRSPRFQPVIEEIEALCPR